MSRTIVAGGSAMVLGGIGLAVGPAAPAEADHQQDLVPLRTPNWRVCWRGTAANGSIGANWATAMWNSHPEVSVVLTCSNLNIDLITSPFTESWFGLETCSVPGTLPGLAGCARAIVLLNSATIDATPDPTTQWKKSSTHEFGHVGGLGHRVDNNSPMTQGLAPPILPVPDQHDFDAIAATYPRPFLF